MRSPPWPGRPWSGFTLTVAPRAGCSSAWLCSASTGGLRRRSRRYTQSENALARQILPNRGSPRAARICDHGSRPVGSDKCVTCDQPPLDRSFLDCCGDLPITERERRPPGCRYTMGSAVGPAHVAGTDGRPARSGSNRRRVRFRGMQAAVSSLRAPSTLSFATAEHGMNSVLLAKSISAANPACRLHAFLDGHTDKEAA
jgi:hypothetical protein